MTSIQTGDAVNFSESAIPDRYFLDSRPTCQFFNVLPFVPIDGHKLTINSVAAGTIGDAKLDDEADAEDAGGTLVTTMPDRALIHFEI